MLQLSKWCFSVTLCFLFAACGKGNGKMMTVNNLEIYYKAGVKMKDVTGLAEFFLNHDLIHPHKTHSVQLSIDSSTYILKMILNDSLSQVPVEMLKEIEYLEAAIDTTVFKNRNFAIEITDAYFNPLIIP